MFRARDTYPFRSVDVPTRRTEEKQNDRNFEPNGVCSYSREIVEYKRRRGATVNKTVLSPDHPVSFFFLRDYLSAKFAVSLLFFQFSSARTKYGADFIFTFFAIDVRE